MAWSRQERRDLEDYQATLNGLIREGLITYRQGVRYLKAAMKHAEVERHEPLPREVVAPESVAPLDLKWLVEQEEVDRYLAYLYWLHQRLGSWRGVGEYLGTTGPAAMKAFKRRLKSATSSGGRPSSSSRGP